MEDAAGGDRNGADRINALDGAIGRNKRNVWEIATQPYAGGAPLRRFPPKLVRPCILAGSALGDTILDPFAGSGHGGCCSRSAALTARLSGLN